MQYLELLQSSADFLRSNFGSPPGVGLVLGSGLGDFLDGIPEHSCSYREIPGFPVSTVIGHRGRLICGSTSGVPFCALQGRSHAYEGLDQWEIVFPVRALALWGIRDFIVTNAAGAINPEFSPGDVMVISDHINLSAQNPLVGPNLDRLGERFPDMTHAYSRELRQLALEAGESSSLTLREGVYVGLKGPSYETPAEIRMLRRLGGDAVGMSTVPEVIALNHMSRRVLGLSCLTNMAAGVLPAPLDHEEVLNTSRRIGRSFGTYLLHLVEKIS